MMKTKPTIFLFAGYTVFMFLIAQFMINPERSVGRNILFAVVSGILFMIFMSVFHRYRARRKSS